jgi:putative PIN family toxin of toxin-antitoxin system
MLKVVLDTNIILSSVSPFSPYRLIFDKLDEFDYELCVSTEILLEYEEKLSDIFSSKVAELTLNLMMVNPNIVYISPKFKMQMIYPDMDDNKFVDCAFAANAHYLVTNDRDYNILKNTNFPKINLLKIEGFMALLKELE